MKEQLISFETAKLAKEKGFIQKGFYPKWRVFNKTIVNLTNGDELYYSAPTQSLLQKWLREVHEIVLTIAYPVSIEEYTYNIRPYFEQIEREYFDTYEEALEKGLLEALKLI